MLHLTSIKSVSDPDITQDELKAILDYDPITGILTWKERSCPRFNDRLAGKRAGSRKTDGRRYIKLGRKTYREHRLIWLYMTGETPSTLIDHKNGIPDDNRWSNLRLATYSQNSQNRPIARNNTSGYPGVQKRIDRGKQTWGAVIGIDGKQKHLGLFATRDEAISARRAAELEMLGEWKRMDV